MCRMFAVSLKEKVEISNLVKPMFTFYYQPHGFGFGFIKNNKIHTYKTDKDILSYFLDNNNKLPRLYTNTFIGHNRMSTSDIDASNNHPFVNENGQYALCHNGYCDYSDREKLIKRGHIFTSKNCDSEILLHKFEDNGLKFLQDFKTFGNMLNIIIMNKDGSLIGVSDGSLYYTPIKQNGYNGIVLSSTGLTDKSIEVREGYAIFVKDGIIQRFKKVFKKSVYVQQPITNYNGWGYNNGIWTKYRNKNKGGKNEVY